MFAIIRLRGTTKARYGMIDTLHMMRLNRKMHCVVLIDSPSTKGMIMKVKDYVTWGEISDDMLKKLISKRGRMAGNRRLSDDDAAATFKVFKEGGKPVIVPVFRLSPPSKGFRKSIKQAYPDGELGFRGDAINELLKRMI